jgi:transposase
LQPLRNGVDLIRNALFSYRLGREREDPKRFLGNFEGLLRSDGYGAYDHVGGPKVVDATCWAHARREVFDEVKLNSKDTTSIQIVAQMDELFAIDARARQEGLSQIDRHLLRLEKSQPLLEQIKAAIQAARTGALPKKRSRQGMRLHANALEPAQSFPRISRIGIERQLGRERDAPGSSCRRNWVHVESQEAGSRASRHHFDR